ncbi:MAG: GNAT family N-acetyltransferase, partial [Acidobacteria bacterium]|nr:GNAT family N-acetyltransferase [Acidobacteriota bacterium]
MNGRIARIEPAGMRSAATARQDDPRFVRDPRRAHSATRDLGALDAGSPAQSWRLGLPTLSGEGLSLREPTEGDARHLADLVTRDTVWRLTPRAPASTTGWVRFVQRLLADRSAGLGVSYAVTREKTSELVGLILVRRLELKFHIAECQFLFAEAFRCSGLPIASLEYVLDFAFRDTCLHRLECRSLTSDDEAVLRGLGCVAEGLLREACQVREGFADQTIWSMLRADWQSNSLRSPARGPAGGPVAESTPAPADVEPFEGLSPWSSALPVLTGSTVTLREIEHEDGEALLRVLEPADIEACIEPPPTTAEMFQHYIAWARRQRVDGRAACFAILANGSPRPVGLIQVRSLAPRFTVAEWGIGLARASRGTGIAEEVTSLITPFVFDTLGAHRLEARTSAGNAAAIASLRRLGAVREACLRQSFLK